MERKIRVGLLGGNAEYGWGGRAHIPAINALPEYELVAVGTSRPSTAAKAAKDFDLAYGYSDYQELINNPEVDVVSVSVKAPLHYEMTMAAIEAGKPVFTEWPLGATTEQATAMYELAREKNVPNVVGLQARVSPGILHLKELVENDYIGTPITCSMTMFLTSRDRDSSNAWEGDRKQGGNALTIHSGHSLDALEFCLGDFAELSSRVTTQVTTWQISDTQQELMVDAPDTILLIGILKNGCVVSAHIASVPGPAPGWRIQIYGSKGSLLAVSPQMLQYGGITLYGAHQEVAGDSYRYQGAGSFHEISIPDKHRFIPDTVPNGPPFNIAQLYRRLSNHILFGKVLEPDFGHALKQHRLLDSIILAAQTGRTVQP
jgi:predicted dehydrogenase